jgi:hypothetical protein
MTLSDDQEEEEYEEEDGLFRIIFLLSFIAES